MDLNPLFFRQWAVSNSGQPIYIRTGQYELPAQFGTNNIDINYISEGELPNMNTKDIVVAVIDTGVDIHHPDLVGRLWIDPNCTKKNKDLCVGKNILNPNKPAYDDKGHGTHVSGIIAANDNNLGVKGITASRIKIMPVKVLNSKIKGFGYKGKNIADYFAKGIEYAIENKADVINMSVGFPQFVLTSRFRAAIKSAEANNIPVVVAAGNNRKDIPVYPCSLESVICVGAIDNVGKMGTFSNYGHMIDILAPGQSIVSTYPVSEKNGAKSSRKLRIPGYENMQGTSQASPFVAGIVAMIKDQHLGISLGELKARLFSTSRTKVEDSEKFSLNGLVDMKKAITVSVPAPYVYPIFKEGSQVVIDNKDLTFEYNLKVKKLSGKSDDVTLNIQSSGNVAFDLKKTTKVNVAAGDEIIFKLKGTFSSLLDDSIVPLVFNLSSNGITRTFKANLSFSMNVDALLHDSYAFNNFDSRLAFSKRGKRTYSLLRYVSSALNKVIDPEYFVLEKRKKTSSLLHLLTLEQKKTRVKNLNINADESVVNVVKGDMNLDGVPDYIVLTYAGYKDESKNAFYLYYCDNELQPLFGKANSRIRFKDNSATILIKNGGNLFNFDKRLINFSWMKHSLSDVGDILVPVVSQEGLIPSIDNSNDLIEFQMPRLTNKTYVLVPEFNNEGIDFKPRLLVNQNLKDVIIEQIESLGGYVQPWETIKTETTLLQPQENNGVLSYIISVGEMFNRRFYQLDFNEFQDVKVHSLPGLVNNNLVLSGNSTFEYLKSPLKESTNSKMFFRLDNRTTGRAAYILEDQTITTQEITTESYSDPLFGFIATTNINKSQKSFFESRYWVQFFNGTNLPLRFPVNRESSFPGVEFSETMEGVFGSINNKNELGVFVNSTLLYGNQVHAIFPIGGKLQRPLGLTLEIPSNCSYMLPSGFKKDSFSSLALNCVEDKKSVLKFVPIQI
jgi:hypothetical protein